ERVEDLYDVVRAAIVGVEACDDCTTETSLSDSPGVDAQLREVRLSSSVAVLTLPATPDQDAMPADDTPEFSISSRLRLTGLSQGQPILGGDATMTYRIRPQAGAPGTEALSHADLGWSPLLERRADGDGIERYAETTMLDAKGQSDLSRASAVYFSEEAASRIGAGEWAGVTQFELQTCVGTTIEQAVFEGEYAPRDNDCAVLPVAVVRSHVAADGSRGQVSDDALMGSAKARPAAVWSTSWSTTNNFVGTDYTNGVSFETWLDLNASDSATTTYGGSPVNGAGTWFEAGARSIATVFNNPITLLDANLTAIGLNNGAGSIDAGIQAMGFTVFDATASANTGAELTLSQILQAAGVSDTTTIDQEVTLAGYSFDDGCGTVSAGLFLKGEIGIDNQATKVTVSGGANGMSVSGVIAPTAALIAESRAAAAYDGFVSFGVALTMAIDILRVTLPFTSTATVSVGNSVSSLTLSQAADLTLSTLAGTIDFSFNYTYWCVEPFGDWSCSGNHSHNLATWDGISHTWNLFNASTTATFGENATFCELYDNDQVGLKTYHNQFVQAQSAAQSYAVGQHPDKLGWETFTVRCQPNGNVAFETFHGRFLQALDAAQNWGVSQQWYIGGWEQFTPIKQDNGTWAFQTVHNRYLQAVSDGTMNQQWYVGGWEQFSIDQ
ncbi:MAG: hypothetical protein K0V04_27125, partial [Deltaproteobacteria bacterium]|nr:hypothetical protein [Deltaproteobacteria bacterium]